MDKTVRLLRRSHNNDQVVQASIIHVAGAVTDTDETYGAYVAAENNTFNNTSNNSSHSNSNSISDSNSNREGEHIDHLPMGSLGPWGPLGLGGPRGPWGPIGPWGPGPLGPVWVVA